MPNTLHAFVCVVMIGFSSSVITKMWGSWESCTVGRTSCYQRTLFCGDGQSEIYPCHHISEPIEEQVTNCLACNSTWKLLATEGCNRTNSQTNMWQLSECSDDSTCLKRTKYSCQDVLPCKGQWKTFNEYCDTKCNKNLTETTILEHFDYLSSRSACLENFVTLRRRKVSLPCQNRACNEWSIWKGSGPCSISCGGGFQPLTRMCLDVTGCSSPRESETRNASCNSYPCAVWADWMESSSCQNGLKAWTRICRTGNSISNNCDNSNISVQSTFRSCSSFNQSRALDEKSCDEMLFTFTLPLIAGSVLLFILILVLILCTFRNYKKKTVFQTRESNQHKRTSHVARTNGSLFLDLQRASYPDGQIHQQPSINISTEKKVEEERGSNEWGNNCSHDESKKSKRFSLVNPVEFHRFDSFPGIAGTMENSEPRITKPRPSVRRAEQQRLKEEQRTRRLRKKKEVEELSWSKTQTLNPKLSEIEANGKKRSSSNGHLRSQSVDIVLNYNSTSPLPMKPPRRSTMKKYKESSKPRGRSSSVGNLFPNKNHLSYRSSTFQRSKVSSDFRRRMNTLQPPKKPQRSFKTREASSNGGIANKNPKTSSESSQLQLLDV